ncbi:MAG: 50S ribosomal protein L29 [Candidatus Omnitrophica bacterium]|nr:50S ribosomal protein L29 [Candidatus Omnitrophota bacterium]
MKVEEIRGLTPEELGEKLSSLKRQLLDLRIQASGGKLDKPHRLRDIRREVAQILTVMRQAERKSAV